MGEYQVVYKLAVSELINTLHTRYYDLKKKSGPFSKYPRMKHDARRTEMTCL